MFIAMQKSSQKFAEVQVPHLLKHLKISFYYDNKKKTICS